MKVVCVKIPFSFVDIKLEVGEIFDTYKSPNPINKGYWLVKDRLGNVIPCDFEVGKYFITLEEWREKQLEKLL
jgi:hypothetical protein